MKVGKLIPETGMSGWAISVGNEPGGVLVGVEITLEGTGVTVAGISVGVEFREPIVCVGRGVGVMVGMGVFVGTGVLVGVADFVGVINFSGVLVGATTVGILTPGLAWGLSRVKVVLHEELRA